MDSHSLLAGGREKGKWALEESFGQGGRASFPLLILRCRRKWLTHPGRLLLTIRCLGDVEAHHIEPRALTCAQGSSPWGASSRGTDFPSGPIPSMCTQLCPHTPSLPCCPCYQKGGFFKLFLLPTGPSRISRPTRHEGSKGTPGKWGPASRRLALAGAA